MMLLGEPGAEIIYPEPGFPIYESMINYSGAKASSHAFIRLKITFLLMSKKFCP